jgi:hypothetical protein
MGRELSFGLGRVLEHIVLTSVAAGHRTLQSETQDDSTDQTLPIGQRRILEHVATTSVEKRPKMPQ